MPLHPRTEANLATLDKFAQGTFRVFSLAAQKKAAEYGCEYVAIVGLRTFEQQAALFAKGRTAPGPKVTNARAGHSWHNFGLAVDYGVFRKGAYLDAVEPSLAADVHRACGAIAPAYGIEWGGNWKSFVDMPHYQKVPYGLTLAKARELKANGMPMA